jgi:hypothetical protein
MDNAQGRIGGPTCVSLVLRGPQYQRYAKPKIVQRETDVISTYTSTRTLQNMRGHKSNHNTRGRRLGGTTRPIFK